MKINLTDLFGSTFLMVLIIVSFVFAYLYPGGFSDFFAQYNIVGNQNDFRTNIRDSFEKVLPGGYSSNSFSVEKILDTSCQRDFQCSVPSEYLMQSRCPFQAKCVSNKCAVVCPMYSDSN